MKKLSDSLNTKTNREEWIAGPAIANAFYNPQLNSISNHHYYHHRKRHRM